MTEIQYREMVVILLVELNQDTLALVFLQFASLVIDGLIAKHALISHACPVMMDTSYPLLSFALGLLPTVRFLTQ